MLPWHVQHQIRLPLTRCTLCTGLQPGDLRPWPGPGPHAPGDHLLVRCASLSPDNVLPPGTHHASPLMPGACLQPSQIAASDDCITPCLATPYEVACCFCRDHRWRLALQAGDRQRQRRLARHCGREQQHHLLTAQRPPAALPAPSLAAALAPSAATIALALAPAALAIAPTTLAPAAGQCCCTMTALLL